MSVLAGRFTDALMRRGVIKAHEKFFVSTANGEAEIGTTLAAFEEVASELAASSDGR